MLLWSDGLGNVPWQKARRVCKIVALKRKAVSYAHLCADVRVHVDA